MEDEQGVTACCPVPGSLGEPFRTGHLNPAASRAARHFAGQAHGELAAELLEDMLCLNAHHGRGAGLSGRANNQRRPAPPDRKSDYERVPRFCHAK